MNGDIIHTVNVGNILGEGIIWDHRNETLLWTDIHGKKLFIMQWDGFHISEQEVPERLCSFGLTHDPDKLIAAFETGVAYFTPKTNEIEWLHKTYDPQNPQIRLNDGRVDRNGNFWVSSIVEDDSTPLAKLYSLSPSENLKIHREHIAIGNGLGFSPCGKKIYFTDTRNQLIEVSSLPNREQSLEWQPFVKTEKQAYPDGATVDKTGNLWSAEWGAGRITAYRPDGTVLLRYKVPASQPTCCTFAGPCLDYLCVTSARVTLSDKKIRQNPSEGGLFILKTNFVGLPETLFSEKHF